MSSSHGIGAFLTPPRHASENKSGITGQAFIRSKPKTFHYSWPETLDKCIGGLDQSKNNPYSLRILEIDSD
jgi:hypothetical protein